jgi:hypothetical protein
MTKHYVQLFTVNEETGDSHIRVWEVSKHIFNKSSHHLMNGIGEPNMEAIVPAERAQAVADFSESNAVVISDGGSQST